MQFSFGGRTVQSDETAVNHKRRFSIKIRTPQAEHSRYTPNRSSFNKESLLNQSMSKKGFSETLSSLNRDKLRKKASTEERQSPAYRATHSPREGSLSNPDEDDGTATTKDPKPQEM